MAEDLPALVSFTIRVPWIKLTEIGFPNTVSAQDVIKALQEDWPDPATAISEMDLLDGVVLEVKVARQVETGRVQDEIVYNAVVSYATWDPSVEDEPEKAP
jgi:hypothetical protein